MVQKPDAESDRRVHTHQGQEINESTLMNSETVQRDWQSNESEDDRHEGEIVEQGHRRSQGNALQHSLLTLRHA